jgi:hypothetical protein
MAREASHCGPLYERRVAAELATYLRGVADMRPTDSNRVYVVALGSGAWEGWGDMTQIRIVEELKRYFFLDLRQELAEGAAQLHSVPLLGQAPVGPSHRQLCHRGTS